MRTSMRKGKQQRAPVQHVPLSLPCSGWGRVPARPARLAGAVQKGGAAGGVRPVALRLPQAAVHACPAPHPAAAGQQGGSVHSAAWLPQAAVQAWPAPRPAEAGQAGGIHQAAIGLPRSQLLQDAPQGDHEACTARDAAQQAVHAGEALLRGRRRHGHRTA